MTEYTVVEGILSRPARGRAIWLRPRSHPPGLGSAWLEGFAEIFNGTKRVMAGLILLRHISIRRFPTVEIEGVGEEPSGGDQN